MNTSSTNSISINSKPQAQNPFQLFSFTSINLYNLFPFTGIEFKCDECGSRFAKASALAAHKVRKI